MSLLLFATYISVHLHTISIVPTFEGDSARQIFVPAVTHECVRGELSWRVEHNEVESGNQQPHLRPLREQHENDQADVNTLEEQRELKQLQPKIEVTFSFEIVFFVCAVAAAVAMLFAAFSPTALSPDVTKPHDGEDRVKIPLRCLVGQLFVLRYREHGGVSTSS